MEDYVREEEEKLKRQRELEKLESEPLELDGEGEGEDEVEDEAAQNHRHQADEVGDKHDGDNVQEQITAGAPTLGAVTSAAANRKDSERDAPLPSTQPQQAGESPAPSTEVSFASPSATGDVIADDRLTQTSWRNTSSDQATASSPSSDRSAESPGGTTTSSSAVATRSAAIDSAYNASNVSGQGPNQQEHAYEVDLPKQALPNVMPANASGAEIGQMTFNTSASGNVIGSSADVSSAPTLVASSASSSSKASSGANAEVSLSDASFEARASESTPGPHASSDSQRTDETKAAPAKSASQKLSTQSASKSSTNKPDSTAHSATHSASINVAANQGAGSSSPVAQQSNGPGAGANTGSASIGSASAHSATSAPHAVPHTERNTVSTGAHQSVGSAGGSSGSAASGSGGSGAVTSESIYRTITKRLNVLEANATLSLQYIEHSSQMLRDVFARMERKQDERMGEMLRALNSSNWRQIEALVSIAWIAAVKKPCQAAA